MNVFIEYRYAMKTAKYYCRYVFNKNIKNSFLLKEN